VGGGGGPDQKVVTAKKGKEHQKELRGPCSRLWSNVEKNGKKSRGREPGGFKGSTASCLENGRWTKGGGVKKKKNEPVLPERSRAGHREWGRGRRSEKREEARVLFPEPKGEGGRERKKFEPQRSSDGPGGRRRNRGRSWVVEKGTLTVDKAFGTKRLLDAVRSLPRRALRLERELPVA